MNILIINTNRTREPFSLIPIGACIVAEAAEHAGHKVRLLDLMFCKEPWKLSNPPIPPLEKGGKGGFEKVFLGQILYPSLSATVWNKVSKSINIS
jgi:hypothetical protein